jgi:hypothetical protein
MSLDEDDSIYFQVGAEGATGLRNDIDAPVRYLSSRKPQPTPIDLAREARFAPRTSGRQVEEGRMSGSHSNSVSPALAPGRGVRFTAEGRPASCPALSSRMDDAAVVSPG